MLITLSYHPAFYFLSDASWQTRLNQRVPRHLPSSSSSPQASFYFTSLHTASRRLSPITLLSASCAAHSSLLSPLQPLFPAVALPPASVPLVLNNQPPPFPPRITFLPTSALTLLPLRTTDRETFEPNPIPSSESPPPELPPQSAESKQGLLPRLR